MKNRNDGGYSLALVLVVMLVISAITTALFTVVKSNISSQAQYTQKMQAQYEAQGKLEKILAELTQNQIVELKTNLEGEKHREGAIYKAIDTICQTVDEELVFAADDKPLKYWFINDKNVLEQYGQAATIPTYVQFTYDFKVTAKSEDVSVVYDLCLKGYITYTDHSDGTGMFIITSPKIITESVDVRGVA